jgi:hypothetical protein
MRSPLDAPIGVVALACGVFLLVAGPVTLLVVGLLLLVLLPVLLPLAFALVVICGLWNSLVGRRGRNINR